MQVEEQSVQRPASNGSRPAQPFASAFKYIYNTHMHTWLLLPITLTLCDDLLNKSLMELDRHGNNVENKRNVHRLLGSWCTHSYIIHVRRRLLSSSYQTGRVLVVEVLCLHYLLSKSLFTPEGRKEGRKEEKPCIVSPFDERPFDPRLEQIGDRQEEELLNPARYMHSLCIIPPEWSLKDHRKGLPLNTPPPLSKKKKNK